MIMAQYQNAATFCEVTYDSDWYGDDYDDRYLTPYRYSLYRTESDSNSDTVSLTLPSFTYYEYLRELYDCRASTSHGHRVPHGYPGSSHSGVEPPVRAGTWHDFGKEPRADQAGRPAHSEPPKTRPTYQFPTLHFIQQRQAASDDYEDVPPTDRTRDKLVWVDSLDKWVQETQLQHRPYMSFVANPPVVDKPHHMKTPREKHVRLLRSAPGCRRDIVAYMSLAYNKALTASSCSVGAGDKSETCPCARFELHMGLRGTAKPSDKLTNKQRNEDKRDAIRKRAQEMAEQRRQRKAYSTPLYTSLTERKQKARGLSSKVPASTPVSPRHREKAPTPQEVVKREEHKYGDVPVTPIKREITVKLVSPKPDDVDKEADKKVTFIDSGQDKAAKKKPKQKKVGELETIAGSISDDLLDGEGDNQNTCIDLHIDSSTPVHNDNITDCNNNNNNNDNVDEARLAEQRLQEALALEHQREREELERQQQQRLLEEQQEAQRQREEERRWEAEQQRETERQMALQIEADRRRKLQDEQLQLRTQTQGNEDHYNVAMNAAGGKRRKGKAEKTQKVKTVKPAKTKVKKEKEKSEIMLKQDNTPDNKTKTEPQTLAIPHLEGKRKGATKTLMTPAKVSPSPKPAPIPAPKPMLAGVGPLGSRVAVLTPTHKASVREEKLPITTPDEVEEIPEEKPKSPQPRRRSVVRQIVKKERRERVCVKEEPKEPEPPPPPPPEVVVKTESSWIFGADDFSETTGVVEKRPVEVEPVPSFTGDLNPELLEKKKQARETRRTSVIAKLIHTENAVRRWKKPARRDSSYQDELQRMELAEERRRRQIMMYDRLKNRRMSIFGQGADRGLHSFEDYGFLAKYCIFNKVTMDMYRHAFDAVDEYHSGFLEGEDVMIALRGVNNRLTEAEEEYIYRVLELTGYKLTNGADFKMFSVLAALSQRVTALDKWMKNMIGNMDFKTLEMKMFMCKTLWECNVDKETNKISLDQVCVDLRAGGVSFEHELEVRDKLSHLTALDLLDFLTYVPLFIMIHESVVQNPLDDSRDK